MSNKTDNSGNTAPLNHYFTDVEKYSDQHISDIDKFERFLETMKESTKSASDQRAFLEFQSTYHSFNKYLKTHLITLTDSEKNELTAITGSKLSPVSTKRMMEDLIYKIKTRHETEKRLEQEHIRKRNEIEELKKSRNSVINWFKLTKFALDYGTISLFSHRLKDSSMKILREKLTVWLDMVENCILPVLNKEYYLLSTLEYNSLEIFLRLKEPLQNILKIKWDSEYDPRSIVQEFDDFADVYLIILKNSSFIDSAFKKVIKNQKTEHGLYGAFRLLIDQPLYNNKPLKMSQYDFIKNTVTGLLLSYFTSREKMIIRSINQIIYLLEIDVKLDSTKKHLTLHAQNVEMETRNMKSDEERGILEKINRIERVLEDFLKSGAEYEDRLYRIESEASYQKWMEEFKTKPVSRFIKFADAFIRNFIDLITDTESLILLYDGAEYKDYFGDFPDVIEAAIQFNHTDLELSGTRIKDLMSLTVPPDVNVNQFISNITRMNMPKALYSPAIVLAQSVLQKISNRCWELGSRLNEIISFYDSNKEIINEKKTKNYDFYFNAAIKKTKSIRHALMFNKETVTIKDFIEAACSLCYYISKELAHTGIDALVHERNGLSAKLDALKGNEPAQEEDQEQMSETANTEQNDQLLDEINQMYKDPLTGLWKFEYFDDQVIPRLYDDKRNYKLDTMRLIFICEINGLWTINNLYGHSTGDKVLVEVSRQILEAISENDAGRNNIAIRLEGGQILGYLNGVALSRGVDILAEINKSITGSHIKLGDIDLGQVSLSVGIYEEKKSSNADKNIVIVKKILKFVNDSGQNNIGFPKDPNQILTERHTNKESDFDGTVLTLYRKK